jgi:hypothetical protein
MGIIRWGGEKQHSHDISLIIYRLDEHGKTSSAMLQVISERASHTKLETSAGK